MPYRGIPIMIIVVALVGALLTTLMPPTYAAQKERSNGKPVSREEEISSAEERTDPKERTGSQEPSAGVQAQAIPGQYIITLRKGAEPTAKARGLARAVGLNVLHVYEHALNGFAARVPDGQLALLQADPDVVSIDEDLEVVAFAQTLPTGIDRVDGDLSSTQSGDGSGDVNVDVAVLDTGIDLNHPDLNVVDGKNCINDGPNDDGNGHGTHVAGTIGAKDDGAGVVGVAPGAQLWAVKVLGNNGIGSISSVICGVDFVTANAGTIEVANMSLGAPAKSKDHERCGEKRTTALHNAICESVKAGVTYAVAAGNAGANANNTVPATYNQVITVSALADFDGKPGGNGGSKCNDKDDTFANFSNYGKDIDLIAPGVCIRSTWNNGGTRVLSGTSMASPHVAGAAALYKASNPAATPSQVKTALKGAGGKDWNSKDDGDSTKEKLLNVKTF
jgi:subtilisin family serine protease